MKEEMKIKIVFLDFEMTGLDNVNDRIIQIGALRFTESEYARVVLGGMVSKKNEFMVRVDAEGVSIHEKSLPYVGRYVLPDETKGETVETQQRALEKFIAFTLEKTDEEDIETVFMVSHNGMISDFRFLEQTAYRCNIVLPREWKYIDTDQCARKLYPRIACGYNMNRLYYFLSQEPFQVQNHDALEDAYTLLYLFIHIQSDRTWHQMYLLSHRGESGF